MSMAWGLQDDSMDEIQVQWPNLRLERECFAKAKAERPEGTVSEWAQRAQQIKIESNMERDRR